MRLDGFGFPGINHLKRRMQGDKGEFEVNGEVTENRPR